MDSAILVRDVETIKKQKGAIVVTSGNQKGGAGKTTNTELIGYQLAKYGIKTLLIDMDPQNNLSQHLILTRSARNDDVHVIKKTLMVGVTEGNVGDLPIKILDDLYLLPCSTDFADYPKYLWKSTQTDDEADHLIPNLFEPLKSKYDVILIDTPPLNKEISTAACVFSDFVMIALQTEADSLNGAEEYLSLLSSLKAKYDLPVQVLGVIPMIMNKRGTVDKSVLVAATKEFGRDNIFSTVIPRMERIKRFKLTGITEKDQFDKRVLQLYERITAEFIRRVVVYGDLQEVK
ncbi:MULTISPECIES: ParA family protein [Lactobacillaceae]|uniref:ParA family protein n=1 Tax=Lactobacillaceae TaxID=33958 RepID=UPI001CC1F5D7|nr:ParA family protein [Lentilactobacillus hilgardii]MBZ2202271.1 ATPase [Lentilactobacillus hilgardii]MBZ2205279.1 ATPase [Lentilactobacillus hilgardii]